MIHCNGYDQKRSSCGSFMSYQLRIIYNRATHAIIHIEVHKL